jgi:hypothetical protein
MPTTLTLEGALRDVGHGLHSQLPLRPWLLKTCAIVEVGHTRLIDSLTETRASAGTKRVRERGHGRVRASTVRSIRPARFR